MLSDDISALIDQDLLLEARDALRSWESTFPMNKISGDMILQESRLYSAAGNDRRAIPLLRAYCDTVDASSYLPDAVMLLLTSMTAADVPEKEIETFCKDMMERLESHPVAKNLEYYLKGEPIP